MVIWSLAKESLYQNMTVWSCQSNMSSPEGKVKGIVQISTV